MSRVTAHESDVDIDIARLSRALWRRQLAVLLTTVAFAGTAFVAASLLPPLYKSDTRIVIEANELARTDVGGGGTDRFGPESVDSQIATMTSAESLGNVAERYHLAALAEFSPKASFLDRIVTRVRPQAVLPKSEIIEAVRKHLNVYRLDQTQVIVVEFSTHDAGLARDVPNAIAAEYLARQKGALLSSNTSATGWLEGEIKDLREAVKTAEERVVDFRAKSNLLAGQNQSVLATQQLSEIAGELSRTRAERAAAEGQAKSIGEALAKGRPLDTVGDVPSSPMMQALREREVALQAGIADLSTTLLENHPKLRALRSQLRDVDAELGREVQKVKSSLEAQADSARQREVALGAEMERLKSESATAGTQEVQLRSLEREAQSQSQLLESYLTRYREAVSRGEKDYLPVDARIVSQAQLPAKPYFPKVLPVTVAAGLAGFVVSALGILLNELFSGRALPMSGRRLDVEPAVESKLDVSAAGTVPVEVAMPASLPEPANESQEPRARPVALEIAAAATATELAVAIQRSGVGRVLVVSAKAAEARPASAELVRRLAGQGRSVVLVDLSKDGWVGWAMGLADTGKGIGDVIDGKASIDEVIHRDRLSPAHVVASRGLTSGEASLLLSAGVVDLLAALGRAYDHVIVECADLGTDVVKSAMGEDTALLVGVDPRSLDRTRETLARLHHSGLVDVVLMATNRDDRQFKAA